MICTKKAQSINYILAKIHLIYIKNRVDMKNILLSSCIVSAVALSACSGPTETTSSPAPSSNTQASMSANPAPNTNNLNWVGDYKGVLPCADCNGIETELELKADNSYELSEEYLGKNNQEAKYKGEFSFDASNKIITLDKQGQNRKFFVGDNFIELRDMHTGEAFDSQLNYKLIKELN